MFRQRRRRRRLVAAVSGDHDRHDDIADARVTDAAVVVFRSRNPLV